MITQESKDNAGVVILSTHTEAENAVKELQRAGFDMKKLSIVGKDYHTEEHVIGYYNAGDRMGFWGKQGAFWGGLWGILLGSAFFFIPGIGPIVVAGPLVSAILAGLQGAVMVGGLSAIGAAFYSIGIPKDSILKYETALKSENYIVLLHGSPDELTRAKDILKNMGHEVQLHSI
ncbi:permease [bacterium]|nr:permease [candidate division CSSED10-310 bacterium]